MNLESNECSRKSRAAESGPYLRESPLASDPQQVHPCLTCCLGLPRDLPRSILCTWLKVGASTFCFFAMRATDFSSAKIFPHFCLDSTSQLIFSPKAFF